MKQKKMIASNFSKQLILASACLALLTAGSVRAATYYVATNGNDTTGNGSIGSPWRTIQHAVDIVQPGEQVIVKAGLYKESITMRNSGTVNARIIIEGEVDANGDPLAIIDNSELVPANVWQAATDVASPAGGQVWRTNTLPSPRTLVKVVGGESKIVMRITDTNMAGGPGNVNLLKAPGATYQAAYMDPKIDVPFWDGVEGMWGLYNGYTYMRFRNGDNPNSFTLRYAPREFLVHFNAKSYITFRKFMIRGGSDGIYVSQGSHHNIVEENTILTAEDQIYVHASDDTTIRNNMFTYKYLSPIMPGPFETTYAILSATDPALRLATIRDHIYMVHKYVGGDGDAKSAGVRLYSATNLTISYNSFLGVAVPFYDAVSDNVDFHHNTVSNSHHSCITSGVSLIAGSSKKIHDNVLTECGTGYRVINMQDGPVRTVYFYSNKVWNPAYIGQFMYPSPSKEYSTASPCPTGKYCGTVYHHQIWVYHNSIVGGEEMLAFSGWSAPYGGLPAMRFINNVFSPSYLISTPPSQTVGAFDYNWAGGDSVTIQSWFGTHNKLHPGTDMWSAASLPDFILPPNSDARSAGIDISKSFTLGGATYPALPGFSPGYFSGTAPDIGAVQSGVIAASPTPTPNSSDTTPPIISSVTAVVSGSSATISWNLNEPATGQVEYGAGANYGTLSILEPSFTYSSHSQILSGLTANTLYHFRVLSKDQAGNLATSGDYTFTAGSAAPCNDPAPIPSGFSAPCPVFGVSPSSGGLSQNFSISLTPDASKTVWIYKTMYITEGSTWKSITLPGSIQYQYWLQGNVTYNLQPTTLGLTAGTHYLASWDWTWDATAQCYKGPGATACGGGSYRLQQITLQ